jgi:PKD repeat protein
LETVYTDEVIWFNASGSYDPDGVVVSYVWDFGDGTNGTGVVISHSYVDDGSYTVTLTVTDDDAAQVSTSAVKTVLNRFPVALFTESSEIVYMGEAIHFNASGSYDPDGSIVSYVWDFGDGSNATEVTTIHAYDTNGTYTVTLTITDDDGASDSSSSTKTILWNEPPVAIFTESAETVFTDEVIWFNASGSYDPDGSIVAYSWNFGDGSNATGFTVQHAYADDGVYTVTLTVTDDKNATGVTTADKTILNRLPVAIFTESAETVNTREYLYFNATMSYDPDGNIVSYLWDFGDGSNGTGIMTNHSYADDGNYTVTLTITDEDGYNDSTSATKTALNQDPLASYSYSPNFPIAGETVILNASSSYDVDGNIINYTWDFGDGNTTTSANPVTTHIFTIEGNYTVTLTITDDDGASAVTIDTIRIRNYPSARFTYSPIHLGEGQPITFNASTSTPNGGVIINYTWNFGDGNITTVTEPLILHTYEFEGNYSVTLNVWDSEELSDNFVQTIKVGIPPIASFTYLPTYPFAGDSVTFNASDSYDPDGIIINYTWNFGDGYAITVTNPITNYTYMLGGNFIVKLTITDNEGITDSTTDTLNVRDYPIANFTWSPDYPLIDSLVGFDASPSSPNGGVITNYIWDFGDGTPLMNTTGVFVTHIFGTVGSFNVMLTVLDSEGLSDSVTQIVKVRDYPTVNFTWSPKQPTATERVTFDASASEPNSGTITGYYWNFGDGSPPLGITIPNVDHTYAQAGGYSVTLIVTNSEGLNSSLTQGITILKAPPYSSFVYTPEVPILNQTVTFDASDSYDPDGSIIEYAWIFGDGNIITTTDPSTIHMYTEIGNYTVTLNVTDNDGLTTSANETLRVIAYPTAEFTWSPVSPQSSKPVMFNASLSKANSGTIINYTWIFGDGNTTTTNIPTINHIYNIYGDYNVTLTVFTSEGLSASKTQIITIAGCSPEADFTWQPSYPIINQTITFNASNSDPNGGTIVLYEWNFGDGSSTKRSYYNPTMTHKYSTNGQFNVTLTITDNEVLTGKISKLVTIGGVPNANFTWNPLNPVQYEVVEFDASTSEPNGGVIESYTWSFGDGNITTTITSTVNHIYLTAGNYTVTLNITDSDGLWDTATDIVPVASAPSPQASFDYSPKPPYIYEPIIFNASSSTSGVGILVNYAWDFGDGNTTTTSLPLITHTYYAEGDYSVFLTVETSTGQNDTTSQLLTVLPISGPQANFTWTPTSPTFNKTVTFDASSSLPGWNGTTHPAIVNYIWDFGDGNSTSTVNSIIYHQFSQPGNYTVILTIIDETGQNDTISKVIEVRAVPWDINGDGIIDMRDIAIVAKAFGTVPGDPEWNPDADITGPDGEPDGTVDMRDIALVASHFGEEA